MPSISALRSKTTSQLEQAGCCIFVLALLLQWGVVKGDDNSSQNTASQGQGSWQPISDWNLGAFADNQIANLVAGGAPITGNTSGDSTPPTLTQLDGAPALHFVGGQSLVGTIGNLPDEGGLGKGKPFAVRITFAAQDKPEGFYGGLFQACGYQMSGFRLMMHDLKIAAEVYLGDGPTQERDIQSDASLEIGRTYTVELRFDGTNATLLIDGKADTVKPMALPAAYEGDFWIGRASGPKYNFNGVIKEVTILTPKQ